MVPAVASALVVRPIIPLHRHHLAVITVAKCPLADVDLVAGGIMAAVHVDLRRILHRLREWGLVLAGNIGTDRTVLVRRQRPRRV